MDKYSIELQRKHLELVSAPDNCEGRKEEDDYCLEYSAKHTKITLEYCLKILHEVYEPMAYAPTVDNKIDELQQQLSELNKQSNP